MTVDQNQYSGLQTVFVTSKSCMKIFCEGDIPFRSFLRKLIAGKLPHGEVIVEYHF